MNEQTKSGSKMSKIKSSSSAKDDKKDATKSTKDDKKDATKSEYSSDFLRQKLLEHFGHKDFKSTLQKEAIKEIMKGKRDVYVSMPTGSGKSLCFQLPGMLHENKVTLVFSPLIALIKDQMDHLTKLKICAESLNSKMTMSERQRVINDLKSIKPSTKFLYITPEQAATDFFRGLLDSMVKYNKVALVAVDECHCVSEMGHQFRRDYLKLGALRLRYPTVKWIALTATASKDVTDDVFKQLSLKEPKSFKTPCFRKNLFYDIVYKNSIQDDYMHLRDFVQKCLKSKSSSEEKPNKAPCGIIYCRTRESVERVAIGLTKQNVVTKPYHAGLNDRDRKQIQEDWTNGKFPVICATNSFGMGVDKSSVRFVAHWDVPQNIAAYYQESGRAGRDGKTSFCRLYYCRQEVKSISFLLNMQLQKTPDCVKAKRSMKEFDKLVDHCESLRCRHLLFSNYFGDQLPDCKKRQLCDVCKDSKAAEKKLEMFHKLSLNGFTSKMDVDFDSSDLYEGGRNGVKDNQASYYEDNDGEFGEGSSEQQSKAKKQTSNLIQKEFERRKQKIEAAKQLEQTQTRSFGIRIRSSIHTSKIAGLNVKKREDYLEFLVKKVQENAEKATQKPEHAFKACDYEDIAVELEYKCFTKNRVLAMYTRDIVAERMRIDKLTKQNELLPETKNHVPKKRTAHGGSAEAMQKDLDSFMKQHNIDKDDTNKTSKQQQSTNTLTGFQTARQLNNKLKEPNRMKKDPLTQMSINSFFSAAAIKREPQDDSFDENQSTDQSHDAKRRKINDEIHVKSEPIEPNEPSEHVEQQVNVKNEPDYDSDAGTERADDSDDDMAESDIPMDNQMEPMDVPEDVPMMSMHNIKDEPMDGPHSDVDTDEPSDNEDDTLNDENQATQRRPIKQEPLGEVPQEPLFETPQEADADFDQKPNIQHLIKSEPEDDPIESDIETEGEDDDFDRSMSRCDNNASMRTQSRKVVNSIQKNGEKIQDKRQNQRPPPSKTTNAPSVAPLSNHKSTTEEPQNATSASSNFNRPPRPESSSYAESSSSMNRQLNREHFNQVGSKSPKHTNTSDGHALPRFHYFEQTSAPNEVIFNVDDDMDLGDFEDLGDEIETYIQNLRKQCEEEFKKLKNVKMEELSAAEIAELSTRLDRLKRKRENIINQEMRETLRKNHEKQERVRDQFMENLFGFNFDIEGLEKQFLLHKKRSQPSTSSASANEPADSKDAKDIKRKIRYNEFMNKTKVKPEVYKDSKHHLISLAMDSFVSNMQDNNQLNRVPKKAIDMVRDDKTVISNKVASVLNEYYAKNEIDKDEYQTINRKVTKDRFDAGDYDSKSIRECVQKMVGAVLAMKNSKASRNTRK